MRTGHVTKQAVHRKPRQVTWKTRSTGYIHDGTGRKAGTSCMSRTACAGATRRHDSHGEKPHAHVGRSMQMLLPTEPPGSQGEGRGPVRCRRLRAQLTLGQVRRVSPSSPPQQAREPTRESSSSFPETPPLARQPPAAAEGALPDPACLHR